MMHKIFDKIQHLFMIKTLRKLETKEDLSQLGKEYPLFLMAKDSELSPKTGNRQECPLLLFLFNISLEVLASAIGQETEKA